jgi:hypothetical protein
MQLHNNELVRSKTTYSPLSIDENGDLDTSSTGSLDFSEKTPHKRYVLERNGYSISLASSPQLRSEAGALIQRMYSWRGYHVGNDVTVAHNPSRLTLVAINDQKLIGTVTLGLDSDDGGLLADELYKQEIDFYRNAGKVCELSKFALDPQHSSKEILAGLFHLAYIYAHKVYKATDLFGEVNPRHVGSHERMFGFRKISGTRTCSRVDAPAVLLHLKLEDVCKKISFLAGSRDPHERSLYPYCFSQQVACVGNSAH